MGEMIGNILIGLYLAMSLLCFIIYIYLDRDIIKERGLYPLKDMVTLAVCALIWPIVIVISIIIYRMDVKNGMYDDQDIDDDKEDDVNG